MPIARQALGKVAIPALGATDREREEAVIDDADAHGCLSRGISGPRGVGAGMRLASGRVDPTIWQLTMSSLEIMKVDEVALATGDPL